MSRLIYRAVDKGILRTNPLEDMEYEKRDDDKKESIQHRLVVYRESTAPLIDFYKKKGNLVDVDARPAPEKVLSEFKAKFPQK